MEHANGSEQQVVALRNALDAARVRFFRWLVLSCVFAIFLIALTVFSRSMFFLAVAGFASFLAWNRWKWWKFVRDFSSKPLLPNEEERKRWIDTVMAAVQRPPLWARLSEYLAAAALLILFAIVSLVVVQTSGTWMRVLYGTCWGIIVLAITFKLKAHHKQNRPASDE